MSTDKCWGLVRVAPSLSLESLVPRRAECVSPGRARPDQRQVHEPTRSLFSDTMELGRRVLLKNSRFPTSSALSASRVRVLGGGTGIDGDRTAVPLGARGTLCNTGQLDLTLQFLTRPDPTRMRHAADAVLAAGETQEPVSYMFNVGIFNMFKNPAFEGRKFWPVLPRGRTLRTRTRPTGLPGAPSG